ncbi:MAG: nucleotidyltransferase domain-containing protein [Proteobacteria bacterium]|nr:nucleotidyltransferase domain-containing protein [Pseudomonadota bacterium]MBU1687163.1 nucleotidyltransferase domain-containing protein [Pseudomonadota bacterium]
MSFGIPSEALARIRAVFSGYPQVERVILFGSRAKGTFSTGSDVDLTLIGDTVDLSLLNRIEGNIDDLLLPWSFDLSIYSQIENPELVSHIKRVGVVFYP